MCIQLVQRYSRCRCSFYRYAVDPCPAYGRRNHDIRTKEVGVGDSCSRHSAVPERNKFNESSDNVYAERDIPGAEEMIEGQGDQLRRTTFHTALKASDKFPTKSRPLNPAFSKGLSIGSSGTITIHPASTSSTQPHDPQPSIIKEIETLLTESRRAEGELSSFVPHTSSHRSVRKHTRHSSSDRESIRVDVIV